MDRDLDPAEIRRRVRRRWIAAGATLACAAILLLLLPAWLRPSIPRARLRTGRVERGALEIVVQASGVMVPAFEKVISSPIEARVERILHRAGERVAAGDEILALDVSASRLEYDRLEERLARKLNEREQQRLALQETLGDLGSRAEACRLDLRMLRYREEQSRGLFGQGLVSELTLKEAEVAASKAAIELARLEEAVTTAGRTTQARMAGIDLEVATLRKEVEEARRQLELATTRADRDGFLTWTVREEGATVRKGDVVAKLADLSAFRVEATISDVHSARLKPGLPVRAMVDGRTLAGRLATVNPTVENGVIRFYADLDDPSAQGLRHNLRADVFVVTETRPDVLKVPAGPFAQGGAVQQVFVMGDGVARRRQARFGSAGRDGFEIVEGLSEGDEVILSDMRDYLHLDKVGIR